jgi:hypothetical protein
VLDHDAVLTALPLGIPQQFFCFQTFRCYSVRMGPDFEFLRRFSFVDPPFSDFSALRSMFLARSASIGSVLVFCFVVPRGARAIRDFSGLYEVFGDCLDFWVRICDLTPRVRRARRSFPFLQALSRRVVRREK